MSLPTAKYRAVIDAVAALADLPSWKGWKPGVWVEAVAMTESSGNPQARHYDSAADAKRSDGRDTGQDERWASYGLFQIEGITALALLGDPPAMRDFSFLYRPAFNIALGVHVLSSNVKLYAGNVDRAIAAYNGGRWGAERKSDGELNDQAYVDRVESNARAVAADRG